MSESARSAQVGYNHNVRHAGRLFHVQTEDAGVVAARISTHIFCEGAVIASRSAEYREWLDAADLAERVRKLLQQQHKAVLRELRDGAFEESIAKLSPLPPPRPQIAATRTLGPPRTVTRAPNSTLKLADLPPLSPLRPAKAGGWARPDPTRPIALAAPQQPVRVSSAPPKRRKTDPKGSAVARAASSLAAPMIAASKPRSPSVDELLLKFLLEEIGG